VRVAAGGTFDSEDLFGLLLFQGHLRRGGRRYWWGWRELCCRRRSLRFQSFGSAVYNAPDPMA